MCIAFHFIDKKPEGIGKTNCTVDDGRFLEADHNSLDNASSYIPNTTMNNLPDYSCWCMRDISLLKVHRSVTASVANQVLAVEQVYPQCKAWKIMRVITGDR